MKHNDFNGRTVTIVTLLQFIALVIIITGTKVITHKYRRRHPCYFQVHSQVLAMSRMEVSYHRIHAVKSTP